MIVDIDYAEGIHIYDRSGKAYVDMTSGICVSALGHCHPVVVEAIQAQSRAYMHTMVYGEHVQEPQVMLAKRLAGILPDQLNTVYFTNSGSEATEGALKLSRRYTGRREVIACRRGYHGSTIGAMSLMSHQYFTMAYQPSLPGVRFIDFNNVADIENITDQTAAVIMEPVRGPAGVELPNPEYLKALRKKCDEVGALLVFDEIQCGMGRTGRMFAFEHYNVVPDILLLAKALGGGMPIGVLIADQQVLSAFTHSPRLGYISTFGGHPVCCAAALAALDFLIENPQLIEGAAHKEKIVRKHLTATAIKEIRSKGLMMAIDLGDEDKVNEVIQKCHDQGILIDWFLFYGQAFRLAPPLTITDEELIKASIRINAVIESLND